jgi:hypothetical protein
MIWVLGSVSSEHTTWRLLRDLVDILRLYARLLRVVADIEEVSGKSFSDIMKEGLGEELKPEGLLELSKRLPPEVFANFITSLLRLSVLAKRVENPMRLSSSEKREVASEIEDTAKAIEVVVEKLGGLEQ